MRPALRWRSASSSRGRTTSGVLSCAAGPAASTINNRPVAQDFSPALTRVLKTKRQASKHFTPYETRIHADQGLVRSFIENVLHVKHEPRRRLRRTRRPWQVVADTRVGQRKPLERADGRIGEVRLDQVPHLGTHVLPFPLQLERAAYPLERTEVRAEIELVLGG